jgi:hypothetical protein
VFTVNKKLNINTDSRELSHDAFSKSEFIVSTFRKASSERPAAKVMATDHCLAVHSNLEKLPLDSAENLLVLRKRFYNPKGFFNEEISEIVPELYPHIYRERILPGGGKRASKF